MRKFFIAFIALLLLWILCARCLLLQNRWSDKKAKKIFTAKRIPLAIRDTLAAGRHIHYAISGADSLPTLVFIHGSPGSWMNYAIYMWDPEMQSRFRMVSIDRPGFGYSDFGEALHLQEQAALMLPVIKSIKTSQPMYLMGHSMGGPIAVELASRAPELFHTIIIAAGALDVKLESQETWRAVMGTKPLNWLLPGAFEPSNAELLYLKKDLVPLQASFSKVKSKVMFVHGDKDTWVPIENIAYGLKMMINAEHISIDTIEGAGHNFPWKNKEDFKKILLSLY